MYETTIRVVEDIRFVMSHVMVPKYVTYGQQDISRTWMRLISFVQGMNPQKRETGQHIEEENENVHLPFVLGHSIANIHSLLVDGAFSDFSKGGLDDEIFWISDKQESDDGDNLRHAKVGRLSQDSSACSMAGRSSAFAGSSKASEVKSNASSHMLLPHSVTWLISECLGAIENWLGIENKSWVLPNMSSSNSGSIYDGNLSAIKRTLTNIRKGRNIFRRLASSSEDHGRQGSDYCMDDLENSENAVEDCKAKIIESDHTHNSSGSVDSTVEADVPAELDGLRFLSSFDWPQIVYDVSSQDISVHIPIHRLLSMLLQRSLRRYFGESPIPDVSDACSANSSSTIYTDFFGHALGGSHPCGFSAFIMEHPLRIRVFCAEVHAGMWRKNGDAALLSCEWYRSVRWLVYTVSKD